MQVKKLRDQLIIDEGIRYYIYFDSVGLPTCGIGHLITKHDPEFKQPIGTKVSKERVFELFDKDIESVIGDCQYLFDGFDSMPDELQEVLANMMFNLGLTRLRKFKKFCKAIKNKDLITAAKEMEDSLWFKQVKGRAKRLQARIIALANCNVEYSQWKI